MESGKKKQVVCVTGASGYVVSWIIKLLLARGYTVRATVRDTDDAEKTAHLRAMDGAEDRLHLLKADLLQEGCFDAAVHGCDCVFHTASPVLQNFTDPQAQLIDPAVKGTLNVLGSCSKAEAVKRRWHALSKTLAEEAAWKFSNDYGIEVITINPGWVIGPLLQHKLNIGAEAILKLINGAPTYPNLCNEWVNVKDVAMAHVLAYEVPSANGRYCLAERAVHHSELVRIINDMYPSILLPDRLVVFITNKHSLKSVLP